MIKQAAQFTVPRDIKGRGSTYNPANRFEPICSEIDPEWDPADNRPLRTEYLRDNTKSLIQFNDSPDIGSAASLNLYRGCEHGCVYCFARPTHEFFGLSSGLDFESRIFVKDQAPQLLRQALLKKSWNPQTLTLSSVTDPYQPIERRLNLARECLKVLLEFKNPVAIITKNRLVTRDLDLLQELHAFQGICVNISLTTLDKNLARKMEPRTSTPDDRLKTIEILSKAGIPVRVLAAPIIPGITDREIPAILRSARGAGAIQASYIVVRLPYQVKDMFIDWLEKHYPERKTKVLNRLRSMRRGKLYHAQFGTRMRGEGPFAEQIRQLFHVSCRKYGLNKESIRLSTDHFVRSQPSQYTLF